MNRPQMEILLNGQPRRVQHDCTVAELLADLEMKSAYCAVEVNETLVPRADQATHRLRDGDRLEVVTLVGGG